MPDATLDELMAEAADLGTQDVAFPIEIFGLARRLTELPDMQATYAHMKPYLSSHPNAFVRRVFFTMVRFMETLVTPPAELAAVVMGGLHDPAPWVQYDAAWLAADYRVNTQEVVTMLTQLAGHYSGDEDVVPNDAHANLARRAAETLRILRTA